MNTLLYSKDAVGDITLDLPRGMRRLPATGNLGVVGEAR